jgi:hypothetical protein
MGMGKSGPIYASRLPRPHGPEVHSSWQATRLPLVVFRKTKQSGPATRGTLVSRQGPTATNGRFGVFARGESAELIPEDPYQARRQPAVFASNPQCQRDLDRLTRQYDQVAVGALKPGHQVER